MNTNVKKLCLSALFLALGLIFTIVCRFFGPTVEQIILPMHIPVLLCSIICGASYGVLIGLIMPLLASTLSGFPMFLPVAIALSVELAVYGVLMHWMKQHLSLPIAMLVTILLGRTVSGLLYLLLLGYQQQTITLSIFISIAYITALPGCILQWIMVPTLVKTVMHMKQQPKRIR